MLQRIQSLYLFIVLVLTAVMFFLPFADFYVTCSKFVFNFSGIINTQTNDLIIRILPIVILLSLIIFICILAIFSFKKRMFQIKLGKINIIFLLALIAIEIVSVFRIKDFFKGEDIRFLFPLILPVISIILILLANRAIKKDENLVRSVDRIR
ncbi:MAG: DUF4293 domain-containing protein [Bacteroidales bacterium]|nr:DUF4293 domain-containing protein [Bacteroidales bacterium]